MCRRTFLETLSLCRTQLLQNTNLSAFMGMATSPMSNLEAAHFSTAVFLRMEVNCWHQSSSCYHTRNESVVVWRCPNNARQPLGLFSFVSICFPFCLPRLPEWAHELYWGLDTTDVNFLPWQKYPGNGLGTVWLYLCAVPEATVSFRSQPMRL